MGHLPSDVHSQLVRAIYSEETSSMATESFMLHRWNHWQIQSHPQKDKEFSPPVPEFSNRDVREYEELVLY